MCFHRKVRSVTILWSSQSCKWLHRISEATVWSPKACPVPTPTTPNGECLHLHLVECVKFSYSDCHHDTTAMLMANSICVWFLVKHTCYLREIANFFHPPGFAHPITLIQHTMASEPSGSTVPIYVFYEPFWLVSERKLLPGLELHCQV